MRLVVAILSAALICASRFESTSSAQSKGYWGLAWYYSAKQLVWSWVQWSWLAGQTREIDLVPDLPDHAQTSAEEYSDDWFTPSGSASSSDGHGNTKQRTSVAPLESAVMSTQEESTRRHESEGTGLS